MRIVESESQRPNACGALVPNIGQVNATHLEDDGGTFSFTFRHATVHCPIVSVTDLAAKKCEATVHDQGGHNSYLDGRMIKFVRKDGVVGAKSNVLPPGTKLIHRFPRQG